MRKIAVLLAFSFIGMSFFSPARAAIPNGVPDGLFGLGDPNTQISYYDVNSVWKFYCFDGQCYDVTTDKLAFTKDIQPQIDDLQNKVTNLQNTINQLQNQISQPTTTPIPSPISTPIIAGGGEPQATTTPGHIPGLTYCTQPITVVLNGVTTGINSYDPLNNRLPADVIAQCLEN